MVTLVARSTSGGVWPGEDITPLLPVAAPRWCPRGAAGPGPVRRQVWDRDGARCTWTDERGRRCTETARLELDHIVPHARGGPDTADNLRVVCRAHNQHAARRAFGARMIAGRVEERRRSATRERPPGSDDGASNGSPERCGPGARHLAASSRPIPARPSHGRREDEGSNRAVGGDRAAADGAAGRHEGGGWEGAALWRGLRRDRAQVAVTKETEGEAKAKFWVLEVGGKGKLADARTQTVRLKLTPKGKTGPDDKPGPVDVAG